MLRRAEALIQQLENPSARLPEQPANEETQEEEEVTPVFEARVIVPNNSAPLDDVVSAVHDTLFNSNPRAVAM